MNNSKDSKFDPSKNETAVIYGPIPPVRLRIINSIFTKIAIVLSSVKKKRKENNNDKR